MSRKNDKLSIAYFLIFTDQVKQLKKVGCIVYIIKSN